MEDNNKQQDVDQSTQQADNTNQQGQQNQQGQNANTNNDNVKAMSALAYLGILFFLPLVVTPESKEARFHANQGLVLLIAWVVLSFINIIPILGQLIWLLGALVLIVFTIMGILNGINGRQKELPLIGGVELIK